MGKESDGYWRLLMGAYAMPNLKKQSQGVWAFAQRILKGPCPVQRCPGYTDGPKGICPFKFTESVSFIEFLFILSSIPSQFFWYLFHVFSQSPEHCYCFFPYPNKSLSDAHALTTSGCSVFSLFFSSFGIFNFFTPFLHSLC